MLLSQAVVKKMYAESTGEDVGGCGWDDIPCVCISTAVLHSTMDITVFVGEGTFAESVTSECRSRKVSIEPSQETSECDIVRLNVGGSNDGTSWNIE